MIRWGVVVFYTASMYATLPFARDWQKWMREQLGSQFSLFVNFSFITAGLLMTVWIARQVSRWRVFLFISLFLLAFMLAMQIDIPEERIHLIQYGLLGACRQGDLLKNPWNGPVWNSAYLRCIDRAGG